MMYAPDGYTFYSVSTPSAFREYLLPIDESEWTADHARQWRDLSDLAELHETGINPSTYRRG